MVSEQDRSLSEILTFGQRSTQKVKVNWSRVKVNGYWSGSVLGRVTGRTMESLTSSYDVSMTWTRADVALADVDVLAWLLMWTDDVIR